MIEGVGMQKEMQQKVNRYLEKIVKGEPEVYAAYKQELVEGKLFCSGLDFITYLSNQQTAEYWEFQLFCDAVEHYRSIIKVTEAGVDKSIIVRLKTLIYKEVDKNNYAAFFAAVLLAVYGFADTNDGIIKHIFQQSQLIIDAKQIENLQYAYLALGAIHCYGLKNLPFEPTVGMEYLRLSLEQGNDMAALFLCLNRIIKDEIADELLQQTIQVFKKLAKKNILKAVGDLTGFLALKNDKSVCSPEVLICLMHAASLGDLQALFNLFSIYNDNDMNLEPEAKDFIYNNMSKFSHNFAWDYAILFLSDMSSPANVVKPLPKSLQSKKILPNRSQYIVNYKQSYDKVLIGSELSTNREPYEIDDEILAIIVNELKTNKRIKRVVIDSVRLNWQLLTEGLLKVATPYKLYLQNLTLMPEDLLVLRDFIKKLPYLIQLTIEDMRVGDNNRDALKQFIVSIIALNTISQLKTDVADQDILMAMRDNIILQKINLDDIPASDQFLKTLFVTLCQKKYWRSLSVDCFYASLSQDTWTAIAQALGNFSTVDKLTLLNFVCYEDLEESERCVLTEAANQVLTALFENLHIKCLNISGWDLNASNVKNLSQLLKNNRTLVELRLINCSLNDAAIAVLADALAVNASLVDLHLSNNDFKEAGIKQLCEKIASNKHSGLRKLHFAGVLGLNTGSDFVKQLAGFIQSNNCLWESLYLEGSGPYFLIKNNLKIICSALENSKNIKYVSFAGNDFTKISYENLLKFFASIKSTIQLNLDHTGLSADTIASIESVRLFQEFPCDKPSQTTNRKAKTKKTNMPKTEQNKSDQVKTKQNKLDKLTSVSAKEQLESTSPVSLKTAASPSNQFKNQNINNKTAKPKNESKSDLTVSSDNSVWTEVRENKKNRKDTEDKSKQYSTPMVCQSNTFFKPSKHTAKEVRKSTKVVAIPKQYKPLTRPADSNTLLAPAAQVTTTPSPAKPVTDNVIKATENIRNDSSVGGYYVLFPDRPPLISLTNNSDKSQTISVNNKK